MIDNLFNIFYRIDVEKLLTPFYFKRYRILSSPSCFEFSHPEFVFCLDRHPYKYINHDVKIYIPRVLDIINHPLNFEIHINNKDIQEYIE